METDLRISKQAKLSPAQQTVVDLMADGWELGASMTFDSRCWLQHGGIGKGGEMKNVRSSTFSALLYKRVIVQTSREFPTATYSLRNSS